jgi:excisionase family DNA binding protein
MTVKEAAEFLHLTTRSIMRLIYDKKLQATKVNAEKRIVMKVWDIDEDSVYDAKKERK